MVDTFIFRQSQINSLSLSKNIEKPCQPDDEVFGYKVCNTYIRGWTYDPMPSEDDWDCRQFGAWGCGYATNGFKTEQECKEKCGKHIMIINGRIN